MVYDVFKLFSNDGSIAPDVGGGGEGGESLDFQASSPKPYESEKNASKRQSHQET